MKIIVDKEFKHDDEKYEPGETVDLPEDLAKDIIEKGFAKNAEKIEESLEGKPADEVESGEKEPEPPENLETPTEDKIEAVEKSPSEEETFEETPTPEISKSESSEEKVWKELERELEGERSRAPAWEPQEPGDQVMGEVIRTGRGPNGRLMELKTPEGNNYIIWEKVALKDLFDRADAGDKVGVRFLGKEESSSGRSYYNFRTAIRK